MSQAENLTVKGNERGWYFLGKANRGKSDPKVVWGKEGEEVWTGKWVMGNLSAG